MGKKDKKKGKGKEKTDAKTEKKQTQKMKKQLATKGEEDIETLIQQFVEQDRKLQEISEEKCEQPSSRSGFTLCAHPYKNQLIFFGGDYFNGGKAYMYNDLFFYNIKKGIWTKLNTPVKPPPRTSHQAVCIGQNGGQMWIFGGEFASPTHSQFYHYRDLWVYHMNDRVWEQVKAPGGPSSRSGHRMVHFSSKKMLVVFGGFHSAGSIYKYHNDVYGFNYDTRTWHILETTGIAPVPRSACQMIATNDRILIYGGFTQERVKKDVDKSIVHTDLFSFKPDPNKENKWIWQTIKQTGLKPSPRCAFSMTQIPGNKALLFGGVFDKEDEDEQLIGQFYNDLYQLDLNQGYWNKIVLCSKSQHSQHQQKLTSAEEAMENDDIPQIDAMSIDEDKKEVYKDDVFVVKVGSSQASSSTSEKKTENVSIENKFLPHPRMKATMVVKQGLLYLYGGLYEDGDKQFTLSDFYTLDIHKFSEWKTIIPLDTETLEWLASDSEDDAMSEDGNSEESDESSDMEPSST